MSQEERQAYIDQMRLYCPKDGERLHISAYEQRVAQRVFTTQCEKCKSDYDIITTLSASDRHHNQLVIEQIHETTIGRVYDAST